MTTAEQAELDALRAELEAILETHWGKLDAGDTPERRAVRDSWLLRSGLTAAEVLVLVELARGKSNKEIGVAVKLSRRTVKNYLTKIFKKLGVEGRLQAALLARELGLV